MSIMLGKNYFLNLGASISFRKTLNTSIASSVDQSLLGWRTISKQNIYLNANCFSYDIEIIF
jgi:hypothetical protein